MRSIAGFPKGKVTSFLVHKRCQGVPFCLKIWPKIDIRLKRMEIYHPDMADNEVVRLDLAGLAFLRLLKALKVIVLQDSVILHKEFPLHPLWKDSLFNCAKYRQYAARTESSPAKVTMPDELIMQKYWPAPCPN